MIISSEMASCTRSAGVSRKSTFSFISREGLKPVVAALLAARSAAVRDRCLESASILGSFASAETLLKQIRDRHIGTRAAKKTASHSKYLRLCFELVSNITTPHYSHSFAPAGCGRIAIPFDNRAWHGATRHNSAAPGAPYGCSRHRSLRWPFV